MITPGLVSISFRKHSPEEIVAACAQNGLQAIEWGGDIHVPHGDVVRAETVKNLTLAHGLSVAAYGSYYRAGYSPTEGLAFSQVLDSATALGAPVIRVWAGRLGSAEIDPENRLRVVTDLAACSEAAQSRGVKLALEFHDNTLTDCVEAADRLLKEIDHPALTTYWQPRHGETQAVSLAGLHALSPWLSHVHVFEWWPTHLERWPLSRGTQRWQAFLAAAAQVPGDRCAMLEFMPHDQLDELPAEAGTLNSLLQVTAR